MSNFSTIVTLEDVKKEIGRNINAADKAGKRLVIMTAVLCKAPVSEREALGFKPKDGVVTIGALRSYFRDTFGVTSKDEAARKLISRAAAVGFQVAEEHMPSIVGVNSYETACNIAAKAVEAYKVARDEAKAKAAAEEAKSKAEAKAKAETDKAATVETCEATAVRFTADDEGMSEVSIAAFIKALMDAGDITALKALASGAAAAAAALEMQAEGEAIAA